MSQVKSLASIEEFANISLAAGVGMRPGAWMNGAGSELFQEITRRPDAEGITPVEENGVIQCRQYGPRIIPQSKRKLMLQDPQLHLGYRAICAPIMASLAMPQFVASDPVVEAYCMSAIVPLLRRIGVISLGALPYGYMACEKLYELRDLDLMVTESDRTVRRVPFKGAVVLKDLRDLDPEDWSPYITAKGSEFAGVGKGMTPFSASDSWVPTPASPIRPADKAYLVVNEPEFGSLCGKSILDPAYEVWAWCVYASMWMNRWLENRAIPWVYGYAPQEVTDEDGNTVTGVRYLAKLIGKLKGEGIIGMPNALIDGANGPTDKREWEVGLVKDEQRGDQFVRILDYFQTLKLRALVIPERTLTQSAQQYGTFALSLTHKEVFETNETLILDTTLEHVNRWLIKPLVKMNFGPEATATLTTVIRISDRRDLISRMLETVINAESKAGGPSTTAELVDVIRAYQQLNIPTRAIGDTPQHLVQPVAPVSDADLSANLLTLPEYIRMSADYHGDKDARLDSKPLQKAVYEQLARAHGNTGLVSKMADAATKYLLSRLAA